MATRRGSFGGSLRPFGRGLLSIDAPYLIGSPTVAEPPPAPPTTPAPPPPHRVLPPTGPGGTRPTGGATRGSSAVARTQAINAIMARSRARGNAGVTRKAAIATYNRNIAGRPPKRKPRPIRGA